MTEQLTKHDYRNAAHDLKSREGELEIDDTAPVSMGDDDGAYVQAWVWVTADEARKIKKADNQ